MHFILEDGDRDDRPVKCHHCRWEGKIEEIKKDYYLLLSNITELFCPQCDKYLGFIQHNSVEDNKAGTSKNN
jgi:hypothetical protein